MSLPNELVLICRDGELPISDVKIRKTTTSRLGQNKETTLFTVKIDVKSIDTDTIRCETSFTQTNLRLVKNYDSVSTPYDILKIIQKTLDTLKSKGVEVPDIGKISSLDKDTREFALVNKLVVLEKTLANADTTIVTSYGRVVTAIAELCTALSSGDYITSKEIYSNGETFVLPHTTLLFMCIYRFIKS